jgi:hypothetical protein
MVQHLFGKDNVTLTVLGIVVEEFSIANVKEYIRNKASNTIEAVLG